MIESLRLPNACFEILPDLTRVPLRGLDVHGNRLLSLDGMPQSLETLNISDNYIVQDGFFLPFPNLRILQAKENNLSFFEDDDFVMCFPSLDFLNLSSNRLKHIGFLRYSAVQHLEVSHNRIKLLSGLPQTLQTLVADSNEVFMIQSRLPPRLERMDVAYNNLRFAGLSLNWPATLRELHLDHNRIEKFPRNLPDSLEILTFNNNLLTELPATLPESLHTFTVCDNRIRFLPKYKRSKRLTIFLIDNNCLFETAGEGLARVFSCQGNWDTEAHKEAQTKIRRCWKRYVFTLRLRHYRRTERTKEELFMVSMMPERWAQIDAIHPVWFRKDPSRNHTDHH